MWSGALNFFDGFFVAGFSRKRMRIGFFARRPKVDAIRSPADEPGVFIEGIRQHLRVSAFRGHHGNFYVWCRKNISLQRLFRRQSSFHRATISDWYPVPAVLTIFFTTPFAHGLQTYKSAVSEGKKSGPGLFCALKAMRAPSGDHEKSPTLNLPPSRQAFSVSGKVAR